MKLMTRASRAPGVSSVGMICAAIASTSAACSGVKNANFDRLARTARPSARTLRRRGCPRSSPRPRRRSSPATESRRNARRDFPRVLMRSPFSCLAYFVTPRRVFSAAYRLSCRIRDDAFARGAVRIVGLMAGNKRDDLAVLRACRCECPSSSPDCWPALESASMTYSLSSLSMYKPLGRPNCFHSAMNLPSASKICSRAFPRSPTNSAAARVDRQRVRVSELARARAELAPLLDELAVFRKFHDAGHVIRRHLRILPGVAVGDEDVAVGRGHHVGRLVEMRRAAAGDAGRAEPHQHLAVGRQLDDLMPFRAVLARLRVGHPDVAVAIDVQAVRKHEQALRRCSSSAGRSRDPSGGPTAGSSRRSC